MKTTQNHTEGPWCIIDASHKYDREGIQVWAGDVIIADVVDDQHGNKEANAALIAAAPELLAALKDLHTLIDKHSGRPPVGKLVAATERARLAIAKSETNIN